MFPSSQQARYVVRLANDGTWSPPDGKALLNRLRQSVSSLGARIMNLRVSGLALEFDVFCRLEQPISEVLATLGTIARPLTHKRLDLPTAALSPKQVIAEARMLFHEERFWEAHEVLEALWKTATGREKQWLQGLILTAAALVHVQKNEGSVVRPMLEQAAHRLQDAPTSYYEWDLAQFLEAVKRLILQEPRDLPMTNTKFI